MVNQSLISAHSYQIWHLVPTILCPRNNLNGLRAEAG